MEKKQKKIAALMQGHTIPFQRACSSSACGTKRKDGLAAKAAAIKNAINGMNGAQYFESNLPSTSKNALLPDLAGLDVGALRASQALRRKPLSRRHAAGQRTFTGHLETAEAIYDGPQRNLVGIKTFSGSEETQTPQHAVLLGMSGAGKSVTVCDLLSQTEGYFAYTVIIEEGLSYGIYTQTVEPNARPIIIQPDGDLTINYLDTKGLPLTPIISRPRPRSSPRMVGVSADEDKQMLRQAQIAKYLNLLYEDVFQDWSQRNAATRCSKSPGTPVRLHALPQREDAPGATTLEAFADFRDWQRAEPGRSRRAISPDSTKPRCCAFPKSRTRSGSPQPRLRLLHTGRISDAPDAAGVDVARRRREPSVMQIATRSAAVVSRRQLRLPVRWHEQSLAHRQNRALRVGLHPRIREGLLRAAAGFLITNHARKHIITLPRALRKRNVYEEVARLLDIPGGEEIVKESYAQLRKFNCWNISIVQQYARFKQSRIRSAVFGNSRQFFLMRQNDRADLDDIGADIALPEVTKHTIMNYPLPDHQTGRSSPPSPICTPTREPNLRHGPQRRLAGDALLSAAAAASSSTSARSELRRPKPLPL